jgi:protease-4
VGKTVVRILAIIGALFILILVAGLIVVVARGKGPVPSKTVLEVNLETGLIENVPDDPVAQAMLRDTPVVRDVVDAIDKASTDDRVAGLVARFGASTLGLAQAQEVRDAVLRFRSHKKFAYAFAEGFGGDGGPGTSAYYVATAFDRIYLQPSGDVQLTGIMMESPFIAGTLEKLGMKFHGDHRYEYKTALNTFTEKKFTPAHKESYEAVMNSWYGQIVNGISQGRQIPVDQVKALIDKAPFLGQEAVDAKLVDGLKYRDEVYDEVKAKAGSGAELLYLDKYLDRAGRPHGKGKTVALIYGVGTVTRGKSSYDPVFGSPSMGSDTVAGAFRAAIKDKDVKAILFRVDSPGGSYIASDAIWREVVQARKAGKPVIVSMGDLAGSGGYFVAMAADKIVAQPGTITASIGVLSGKVLTTGGWNKLGISWDEVHAGNNATFWTGTHDYSPQEWARFQSWLDRVYADFTGKVADGRKLPKDKVLQIAKGRIWTGEDAKNLGLVDELGGFDVALKLVKQAINVPESEDVKLKVFPEKKSLVQTLLAKGADNSEKEANAEVMVRTLQIVQPIARRMQMLTGLQDRELMTPIADPAQ